MQANLNKCRIERLVRRAGVLPRRAIGRGLPLCTALLMVSPGIVRAADTVFEVTYLETRVSCVSDTQNLLRRYARQARAAAASAGAAAAAAFHIDVLQEIDRADRCVLLEWADRRAQLEAIDAAVAADLTPLQGELVAPADQRSNHPLPAPAGAADAASAPAAAPVTDDRQPSRAAVYSVTHLDIGTPDQSVVIEAVRRLVNGARRARGNLRAEAWQQNSRANHYALLFVWRNRADRDAFAGSAVVRRYRSSVAPLLGSPYDERLFRLAN